jgi:hypothetical protein
MPKRLFQAAPQRISLVELLLLAHLRQDLVYGKIRKEARVAPGKGCDDLVRHIVAVFDRRGRVLREIVRLRVSTGSLRVTGRLGDRPVGKSRNDQRWSTFLRNHAKRSKPPMDSRRLGFDKAPVSSVPHPARGFLRADTARGIELV